MYSLGVLLYLLLSGHHPHPASYDPEPQRLHEGDLDTILDKALRTDAADRYQTVDVFADDLTRYLRHEPVSARRASLAYRIGKFVRRNRVGAAAAAVTLCALIAATMLAAQNSVITHVDKVKAFVGANIFNTVVSAGAFALLFKGVIWLY